MGEVFSEVRWLPGLLGTHLLPGQHVLNLVEESSHPKPWDEFQGLLGMIKISLSYEHYDTTK